MRCCPRHHRDQAEADPRRRVFQVARSHSRVWCRCGPHLTRHCEVAYPVRAFASLAQFEAGARRLAAELIKRSGGWIGSLTNDPQGGWQLARSAERFLFTVRDTTS